MPEQIIKDAIFLFADTSRRDYFEMYSLCLTAGYKISKGLTQRLKKIDRAFYFGVGKINELVALLEVQEDKNAPIIVNVALNSTQKRNISRVTNREVIDRNELIFIIFKRGAKTSEAKLQVEIAELKYLFSQLVEEDANYSQVTSGSGHNKGTGEKQKELNRREISNAISQKVKQLEKIKKARQTARKRRNESPLTVISVVGYTNAGKSTLINSLLEYSKKKPSKEVLAKDQLFATLQTSSRLIDVYNYPSFIISDTVGFVSDLPHFLVKAFHSTLEEIKESDYIIEVVDISSEYFEEEMKITSQVLEELGAGDIPKMIIYNKSDLVTYKEAELDSNEMITSLHNKEEFASVFSFIIDNITSTWDRKSIVFPLDFDFREFARDNYIVSKIIKKDGIHCVVYFNPKTKYRYINYFSN